MNTKVWHQGKKLFCALIVVSVKWIYSCIKKPAFVHQLKSILLYVTFKIKLYSWNLDFHTSLKSNL